MLETLISQEVQKQLSSLTTSKLNILIETSIKTYVSQNLQTVISKAIQNSVNETTLLNNKKFQSTLKASLDKKINTIDVTNKLVEQLTAELSLAQSRAKFWEHELSLLTNK